MFIRIAIRNVFRNKRRTAFSLGVITIGVAIMFLVIGFVAESLRSVKEGLVEEIGSAQVADPRFWDNTSKSYEYLIAPDAVKRVEEILNNDKRVLSHTLQIGFAGLVGNEKGSTLLVSRGLIPGNKIEDYSDYITEGKALGDDGQPQIILGRKLAETLNVKPGEVVSIATGTANGTFNALSVTISGVFKYNSLAQEGQLGFVPLSFAQKLLKTQGSEKILIQLRDLDEAESFAQDLQTKLDAEGIKLQVKPWQKLAAFYDSVKAFWGVFSGFSQIGVFILVLFSVLEVLTMSFLERTREVGTIRAIGTKRRQIFSIFMMEGVVIGFLGGALGVLAGAGLAALINTSKVGWLPPGALEPVPMEIAIGVSVMAAPFVVALISTTLGTLYPAWKTSRLNIVKALSYV